MIRIGPISWVAAAALFLVAVSACTESAVSGRDEGATALRGVVQAENSLVYTGFKRTIYGEEGEGRATRMKASRFADGRTLLEWTPGDGETRRWAYRTPFGWRANPELLLQNYKVTVDTSDGPAVAWRETRRLMLRGRWPGRPSLDLLVDKETSLVLREEFRDSDGKPWITTVFDAIDYRPPDEPTADAVDESLAGSKTGISADAGLPLRLTTAPDGFERAVVDAGARGGVREDWTDGLAAFSVVERPADRAAPVVGGAPDDAIGTEGELRSRRCSGRASVVGVFSGIEVTVDGNLVTADELERVVRGLAAPK